jgi:succinate dehydrogenase/fumarate reductase flavoprotein subunit
MKIIKTDVLVVGAGGAGLRAAIEAKEQGASVFLVGKEVLGCAHTGMAMGGLNASMVPPATPSFHAEITNEGGYFINNQKIVKAFTEEMPARVYDLERYGVMFDRKEDGGFYVWAGPKQKYPLNVCVGDYTGREMMQGLVDQCRKIGVVYKDECFVSRLLTKRKSVIGAVTLDLKTGKIFVICARSTILATGGAGRMYEVTTNAASNTGDGYALALDAGCTLIDMEMVQFHPTGIAYPPSVRGVLVTEKVRAHGGILRNKNGERFMSKYFPIEMELAKRDEVSRSIYQEVKEGRGTKKGGMYLHVDHWRKDEILDKIPDVYEQHKNIGIDITKEPMEIYPSMHHMMGGIRMDEWGKTNVHGLFACGEVAGGVHGANRLGGNSIAEGQVFGRRSAISAVKYAKEHMPVSASISEVENEVKRIYSFRTGGTGVSPHVLESKLKKLMWEYVGIYRNEKDLLKTKKEIEMLVKEAKYMKARSDTNTRNRDLQDCLEVANMLKTAYAVVLCALDRKESRGAHSRSDFPDTKKSWEKNIILCQEKRKLTLSYSRVVKSP